MIIDRSLEPVVVDQDVIDKTFKSYQDLMRIILQPNSNTIFDKVDDYLIGRRTKLPAHGSSPNTIHDRGEDREEEEEGDREELVDRIIESILRFPIEGLGVLEGRLMERPYSLMTLFTLVGHRDLIYSFVKITGIDSRDLDCNRSLFKVLSKPTQRILKSIEDHQRDNRLKRALSIPPDVQRRIDRLKDRIRSQDRLESEQRVEREDIIEGLLGPQNDSDDHPGRGSRSSVRTGDWIGDYFIEDYDQERDEEQDRHQAVSTAHHLPTHPIIHHHHHNRPSSQSSDRNLAHEQRKRSKLSQILNPPILRDHSIDREDVEDRATRLINNHQLPNSSPLTFQITTTQSISNEPSELETPPYFIQLDHIPIDASPQSVLFFLRHGPEIFKTVRTQNQRIDALGRNLNKFRLSFDHHSRTSSDHTQRGTGSLSLKLDLNRFKTINYEDLTFLPTPTPTTTTTTISHEFQSILIKFDLPDHHLHPRAHPPPPSEHSRPHDDDQIIDRYQQELVRLRQLCHSFIHHFHAQKFFKFDPLCPKLICRFSSPPSSSSLSSSNL